MERKKGEVVIILKNGGVLPSADSLVIKAAQALAATGSKVVVTEAVNGKNSLKTHTNNLFLPSSKS
jgi:hypothetical protein